MSYRKGGHGSCVTTSIEPYRTSLEPYSNPYIKPYVPPECGPTILNIAGRSYEADSALYSIEICSRDHIRTISIAT